MEKVCMCTDPSCPVCHGHCENEPTITLYRIDMIDSTGCNVCEKCGDDMLESGLFDTEKNFYS